MTRPVGPTLITLACAQCSGPFTVPLTDHKRGKGKYCSRACTAKGQQHRVSLPCARCSTPFTVPEWQRRRGLGKFCSMSCAQAAKDAEWSTAASRTLVALVCKQCGTSFERRPGALRHKGSGKFCSPACANKGRKAETPVVKPKSIQKPLPVTPRADDLPLVDGGSHVRCHGCQEFRLRGTFCPRCEWRAFQEVAS
jgi:hypothetical protein